jgi:hypothetical protein
VVTVSRSARRELPRACDEGPREALEAQQRKKPSRIGEFVLKILGFKGQVGPDHIE